MRFRGCLGAGNGLVGVWAYLQVLFSCLCPCSGTEGDETDGLKVKKESVS